VYDVMALRPLSQMAKLVVLPEVSSRITSGKLPADRPVEITQFRLIQGAGKNIVEINDEVRLLARVRARRPIQAGEALSLADIHSDECYIELPAVDGKPAGYFVFQSFFLELLSFFDFTPNGPSAPEQHEEAEANRINYPIAELAAAAQFCKAVRPVTTYKQLSVKNWPPAPGYYPGVLLHVHNNPDGSAQELADVVAQTYDETYWTGTLAFWTQVQFFHSRLMYVKTAIERYLAGDFISSIHVITPQFEGIIRDYLERVGITPSRHFKPLVNQLQKLLLTRQILLFPRTVLELMFEFLESGTFLRDSASIQSPQEQVSRHGIAHGRFVGFENRDIALKYLILLESLSFLLLHDRLVTGSL
jgi:hypothetical protein